MPLRTLVSTLLIASLAFSPRLWAQDKNEEAPQVEPKFVWGLLVQYAISKLGSIAFDAFANWAGAKMKSKLQSGLAAGAVRLISKDSGASIIAAGSAEVSSKDAVNTTAAPPSASFRVDDGKENYQAAQVSIGVADAEGKLNFRPLSQGFKTGERFKLHVLSTFAGHVLIENINPRGERRQIYPAHNAQVVAMQAGKETMIPLGDDEYFEFARATGEEQLLITLRDPRAKGPAKSTAQVNRKDEKYGSRFVQEVTPDTYPSLTEAIKLVHF